MPLAEHQGEALPRAMGLSSAEKPVPKTEEARKRRILWLDALLSAAAPRNTKTQDPLEE
jgi:hypothetical protein